ncbi:MAG: hypothetical protein A2289_09290 [Deltaproteobacteria bacterium RIFOXYA12_FULL_58_15]|nr:MAG: hypothetical protein A2289_09290 [Deltaproteobacteria bacterium RIFOXYA12_FULL_58_15]OGR12230.1 MAG: hypothetical protein A2341_21080 [Deltaproteobacteria bacterium RIFOXYB12_FULL_58_9]
MPIDFQTHSPQNALALFFGLHNLSLVNQLLKELEDPGACSGLDSSVVWPFSAAMFSGPEQKDR